MDDVSQFVNSLWERLINRKDVNFLDEIISPQYTLHTNGMDMHLAPQDIKPSLFALFAALPDLMVTVDFLLCDGDLIASHETWRGTHTGEFQGNPPTGKRIVRTSIHILRLQNWKIIDEWAEGEPLERLLWQLIG